MTHNVPPTSDVLNEIQGRLTSWGYTLLAEQMGLSIASLRAQLAAAEEDAERLAEYATHYFYCGVMKSRPIEMIKKGEEYECDCGYNKVIAAHLCGKEKK
jgi:hypothetical protein